MITALWLVIVNLFALIVFNRLNLAPDTAFAWLNAQSVAPVPRSWDIVGLHNRWDAYWYLDIVRHGYYLRGPQEIANVVFFPLYPLLVWVVMPAAGGDPVLSGWIVSSVFLFLGVWMLIRLVREFHPGIDPLLPVIFLLSFPTAFVLNAVYAESLFLFLSLSSVYYSLRRNFLLAGLFAALASATRVAGLFLGVLLVIEFIRANGWKSLATRQAWRLTLAPAGAVIFFAYHWIAFGNFFLYLKIQRNWGRDFGVSAADYALGNNAFVVNTAYDIAASLTALVLAVVALRRLRISYGAYMLVSLGVALSTGTAVAIARYAMMLFPIYLIAAGMRSRISHYAWLCVSILLMALTTTCFVHHYWIG